MPMWLTGGQTDEWLAARPDDAMAMLLASKPTAMEASCVNPAVKTRQSNSLLGHGLDQAAARS